MNPSTSEIIAAVFFVAAIVHTFSTQYFERLAHSRPAHAGLWHLLGEVEVVFGFWAALLIGAMIATDGLEPALDYLDTRNFTEALFVFAIMVIAASKPVLYAAQSCIHGVTRALRLPGSVGLYFTILTLTPLLGSLITEPAAMTLAALILRDRIFAPWISTRLKYATLGVLLVNVSIGGTLTHFAAPPVLMVASQWQWNLEFMLHTFGWKAALAVAINAAAATALFHRQLAAMPIATAQDASRVPRALVALHLALLAGVVLCSHHPAAFIGLLLFFLGIAHAYAQFQDRLILREGMLVSFFLAGLVVLGGQQQWWLQPVLMNMSSDAVFIGATALTAVTDNAALTYLGSLVEGLTPEFKYMLVAGAVTGGGLTIIANAPNPAGIALLRGHFQDGQVSPLKLLLAALGPTLVAASAFYFL